VRLLTYNIHKGIGGRDRRYRLDRTIDVIERENPDLVCLQEVDRNVRRSRRHDQPAMLAEYFNAHPFFQLNVHLQQGGYGNLILSRWKIVRKHRISIRFNARKARGALVAVIKTPEGNLHLVNTHLGLAAAERAWQVHHLVHHRLFRESGELPTVIAGDFNDWRNLLAAGDLVEQGFHPVTSPPSRYFTFPAYLPVGALDKAFVRGDVVIRKVRVVHTLLTRSASDHLPLVIDFHLGSDRRKLV